MVPLDTATGRPERVAAFAGGDFPLGFVDSAGGLSLGAGGAVELNVLGGEQVRAGSTCSNCQVRFDSDARGGERTARALSGGLFFFSNGQIM